MNKNKLLIVPGLVPKLTVFSNRLVPRKLAMRVAYNITQRKLYKDK